MVAYRGYRGLGRSRIEADIVCGTSIGAFVGAAYVAGRLRELRQWAEATIVLTLPLAASFGLSRRHFGGGLWTSRMVDSRVRFSDGLVFSGTLYFSDLVQSLKSPN
jgi:NTE family protein